MPELHMQAAEVRRRNGQPLPDQLRRIEARAMRIIDRIAHSVDAIVGVRLTTARRRLVKLQLLHPARPNGSLYFLEGRGPTQLRQVPDKERSGVKLGNTLGNSGTSTAAYFAMTLPESFEPLVKGNLDKVENPSWQDAARKCQRDRLPRARPVAMCWQEAAQA